MFIMSWKVMGRFTGAVWAERNGVARKAKARNRVKPVLSIKFLKIRGGSGRQSLAREEKVYTWSRGTCGAMGLMGAPRFASS
jgi:hypothetical protein